MDLGHNPGGSDSEESACNAGDPGSIPGSGRSRGGRHGNTLQYSGLENSMDRGAWWATVHAVAKSQTWLSDQHFPGNPRKSHLKISHPSEKTLFPNTVTLGEHIGGMCGGIHSSIHYGPASAWNLVSHPLWTAKTGLWEPHSTRGQANLTFLLLFPVAPTVSFKSGETVHTLLRGSAGASCWLGSWTQQPIFSSSSHAEWRDCKTWVQGMGSSLCQSPGEG